MVHAAGVGGVEAPPAERAILGFCCRLDPIFPGQHQTRVFRHLELYFFYADCYADIFFARALSSAVWFPGRGGLCPNRRCPVESLTQAGRHPSAGERQPQRSA